jgi:amino acid adenylation domain-containing protein
VAAMQAALRADAVYVPLDTRAPVERLAGQCRDCGIEVLFVDQAGARSIAELRRAGVKRFILLDSTRVEDADVIPRSVIDAATASPRPATRAGDDLAYILYTSGSTGTPKGVMVSHRNALTFVQWAARHYGFDREDRILCHAPLTFDLPVCDLYNGFSAGATVVLLPEEETLFPVATVRTIRQERITSLFLVPSVWISLMDRGGLLNEPPGQLRRVLYSGEAFPVGPLLRLKQWADRCHICNLYGPIETNGCTYYCVEQLNESDVTVPIGRAIDRVTVSIRDEAGNTSDGPGEIWVQGGCVSLGYWGDPELTARKSRTEADGRWFLTGDLGSRREDGNLVFHGRRDAMVKSRGVRIELGEVESVIATHPDVREVAVVAVPDKDFGNLLYAWVVLRDAGASTETIAAHAAKVLPPVMLPRRITPIESLPKTLSGKVSRSTLAADHMHNEDRSHAT